MRRLSLVSACVLLLAAAGPAAAAKPLREPAPWVPLSFLAGEVCAFDVTVDLPGHNQKLTTFFDRSGAPRASIVTGHAPLRAHNDETDAEVIIQGGGRQSLGGDEDTFVLDGTGVNGVYFFPGDVTPVGVGDGGLFIIKGSFHEVLDLNTNLVTLFEYRGTAIDVCAALAG